MTHPSLPPCLAALSLCCAVLCCSVQRDPKFVRNLRYAKAGNKKEGGDDEEGGDE